MKSKTLLLSLVGLSVISLFSFTKNTGTISKYNHVDARHPHGAPARKTGAPGDQGNCKSCHGGTIALINSGAVNLTFSGANNQYIPGSTYTITVGLPSAPSPTNGFEIVALRNSDDANVGTWSLVNATNTQIKTGGGRSYVTHTTLGNSSTLWTMDWIAPTNPEGDITFYMASVISNDNGDNTGDEVHLKELVIQEDASSEVIEQTEIVEIDNSLKIINDNNYIKTNLSVNNASDIFTSVIALNGKVIYSNNAILVKGNNNLEPIDFNQFSKGIYIINYKIGTQLISRKILI